MELPPVDLTPVELPPGCLSWDYKKVPQYNEELLIGLSKSVLQKLADSSFDLSAFISNTCPTHQFMFEGLTLPGYECYAGNYRGSTESHCLRNYPIYIGRWEGTHPYLVDSEMALFADWTLAELEKLRNEVEGLNVSIKYGRVLAKVSEIFMGFLRIHPYPDGNGHTARILLTGILLSFGIKLKNFTIHPRPPEQGMTGYIHGITMYRYGDVIPFIDYLTNQLEFPPSANAI